MILRPRPAPQPTVSAAFQGGIVVAKAARVGSQNGRRYGRRYGGARPLSGEEPILTGNFWECSTYNGGMIWH